MHSPTAPRVPQRCACSYPGMEAQPGQAPSKPQRLQPPKQRTSWAAQKIPGDAPGPWLICQTQISVFG